MRNNRQRITVDMEYLMVRLLSESFAESGMYYERPIEVRPEPDVDSADVLPLVIVGVGQGHMISNGAPGLAWEWNVSLSILHDDEEECSDLADHTYELMHGYHDNGAGIQDVGSVVYVEDVSMPSRTGTYITPAGGLTQFDGAWTVTVQKFTRGDNNGL